MNSETHNHGFVSNSSESESKARGKALRRILLAVTLAPIAAHADPDWEMCLNYPHDSCLNCMEEEYISCTQSAKQFYTMYVNNVCDSQSAPARTNCINSANAEKLDSLQECHDEYTTNVIDC